MNHNKSKSKRLGKNWGQGKDFAGKRLLYKDSSNFVGQNRIAIRG